MSVLVDKDGPVTIVTIDRPARRNAVDPDTAVALRDAFAVFADDDSARVAILTGSEGISARASTSMPSARRATTPTAPGRWDRRACCSTSR